VLDHVTYKFAIISVAIYTGFAELLAARFKD